MINFVKTNKYDVIQTAIPSLDRLAASHFRKTVWRKQEESREHFIELHAALHHTNPKRLLGLGCVAATICEKNHILLTIQSADNGTDYFRDTARRAAFSAELTQEERQAAEEYLQQRRRRGLCTLNVT